VELEKKTMIIVLCRIKGVIMSERKKPGSGRVEGYRGVNGRGVLSSKAYNARALGNGERKALTQRKWVTGGRLSQLTP